jgi:hypothetical protein
MTRRKTTVKTAVKTATKLARKVATPVLVPRANGGGALWSGGTPGNAGGSGRPPDEFKALMRSLADRGARALAVASILDDPSNPLFLSAAKWATEQGYGRPAQSHEVTGSNGEALVLRVIYDDEDEL